MPLKFDQSLIKNNHEKSVKKYNALKKELNHLFNPVDPLKIKKL